MSGESIERLRDAVLAVLRGEIPADAIPEQLAFLWSVANKMETCAEKAKKAVTTALAPHAAHKDAKPPKGAPYTIQQASRRLAWEPDTVRGLLSSKGLPPEMGLDVVFVPSPSKVEDLLARGFLSPADVQTLERSSQFVSVRPSKDTKAALEESWAGFTGAERADEDE